MYTYVLITFFVIFENPIVTYNKIKVLKQEELNKKSFLYISVHDTSTKL